VTGDERATLTKVCAACLDTIQLMLEQVGDCEEAHHIVVDHIEELMVIVRNGPHGLDFAAWERELDRWHGSVVASRPGGTTDRRRAPTWLCHEPRTPDPAAVGLQG